MIAIPKKIRLELANLPRMARCERLNEGDCSGRVEWHHAIQYQNKRLQAVWAILGMCYYHHRGDGKNDEKGRWIALQYAMPEDLRKCPKVDWTQMKKYLDSKYGCGQTGRHAVNVVK